MKTALMLVAALCLAACGDGFHKGMLQPDAGAQPTPDAMADAAVDAPPEMATFTSYVKDLIVNQTSSTTLPKPYVDFATLPDPDGDNNNGSAYGSLFP